MARVLSWNDIILFGRAFLILALPMTWIVAEQFQADRFDTINVAAGGTGHQMMTSGDKVRASGTFTFVSGIVFFYCFAVALSYTDSWRKKLSRIGYFIWVQVLLFWRW